MESCCRQSISGISFHGALVLQTEFPVAWGCTAAAQRACILLPEIWQGDQSISSRPPRQYYADCALFRGKVRRFVKASKRITIYHYVSPFKVSIGCFGNATALLSTKLIRFVWWRSHLTSDWPALLQVSPANAEPGLGLDSWIVAAHSTCMVLKYLSTCTDWSCQYCVFYL